MKSRVRYWKYFQTIGSSLVGELVLFAKQAKDGGLPFALCEVPPMLRAILNRFRGGDGDGGAGVLAMLDTPPKGDGGRAMPSATDRDEEVE